MGLIIPLSKTQSLVSLNISLIYSTISLFFFFFSFVLFFFSSLSPHLIYLLHRPQRLPFFGCFIFDTSRFLMLVVTFS